MGKFVVVYKGGDMGAAPEAHEAAMQAWTEWFGSMGKTVTDSGNPFGPSTAINADGSRSAATAALTGYSIIEADDLDHATKLVATCPNLSYGGTLEIYEAMPM